MSTSFTEYKIQQDCFVWFWNTFPELKLTMFHVPNGGQRGRVESNRLKSIGVVAGIPDLCWLYNGKAYFFEMKRPKSGVLSERQQMVHFAFKRQKIDVFLITTFEQFQQIIQSIVK